MRPAKHAQSGFTLVEMLIVLSIVSLSLLIANTSYSAFRESSTLSRAARIVAADAGLARSYAIRNRTAVSLVADEANLSYVLRDETGNVYLRRDFAGSTEITLGSLDVRLPGDSISFNSRGLMVSGAAEVDVVRNAGRRVSLNAIGRWQIDEL